MEQMSSELVYCPSNSSPPITCYDSQCCCVDTKNTYYCCQCEGSSFPLIVIVLMLVGLFVFVLLLVVGIRKFFMNRRNLSRNIGAYRQFGTQPASHPSNHIIYQPNFNHNNPPNTYPNTSPASNPYQNQLNPNPNLTYPPQLPNAYFQQNKESIYMGQPVSETDQSLKNQRIYVH